MLPKNLIVLVMLCLGFVSPGFSVAPAQSGDVQLTATELLGRPTDTSITVNVIAGSAVEAYFEYGVKSGVYSGRTPAVTYPAGARIEVVMGELKPNTRYYYRMQYRVPGAAQFTPRPENTFYTQRAVGSTFTFTVQSDSHIYDKKGNHPLYEIALTRV